MYFLFSSQELPEPVHHVCFMLHKGMGIAVKRDGRILVAEDLGKRFYIHAAFEGAGGKGMPQGVKSFVRYFQLFQEQFKTSLVGADGNGVTARRHHKGRSASSFQRFHHGQ